MMERPQLHVLEGWELIFPEIKNFLLVDFLNN
jgi:hypothetical protein